MGEIYKAQDTRLNRFVAIKILPASMSADPGRRRRFLQEAQAASALNHPNIITIHDIVTDSGKLYMVMEYIAGKTVHELTPPGGMPIETVLQYGIQIADALAAAHSVGIIHRDLKPANVMVTGAGLVKLLDFGLAKLTGSPISNSGDSETLADMPLTAVGAIVGTLNYMSPEQAEGRMLDGRSDIFSFGSVLYEMITGKRAFRGESGISTLSAVLKDEVPAITKSLPNVPARLEEIVFLSLRKDPEQRWQSMREMHGALAELKWQFDSGTLVPPSTVTVPATVPPKSKAKAGLFAALGVATLLAAGGGGWWMIGHREPQQSSSVSTVPIPAVLTNDNIVDMVKAGVAESVIVSQIKRSETRFDLSPKAIIRLTEEKVAPKIIQLMHEPSLAGVDSKPSSPTAPPVAATPAPALPDAPHPMPAVAAVPIGLADGQPVKLTLTMDVPADAKEGFALTFRVLEDVIADKRVVVAKGASGTGEITQAAKKKLLKLGGKMTFRLLQIDAVDGQKLAIRSTPASRAGADARRPFDFPSMKKSKDLAAASGTELTGYIDGTRAILVK